MITKLCKGTLKYAAGTSAAVLLKWKKAFPTMDSQFKVYELQKQVLEGKADWLPRKFDDPAAITLANDT